MSLTRESAFLVLNAIPRIGWITLKKLMNHFNNDPIAILNADSSKLEKIKSLNEAVIDGLLNWRKNFSLDKELSVLNKLGAQFISFEHNDYPPLLKTIYDPPIGLYFYGPVRPTEQTIAIIGSRKATIYGMCIADQLACELAARGFCVVSGFARGIDTAAHKGALKTGKTAGILGCSIDRIYPPENASLYSELREKGSLISEFKLGSRADRMSFPRRNRILSGMSQAIVVVESDMSGGSMITAEFALEHNRQVFAVPGRIDSELSRGCHMLIRNGATLINSVEDIIEDLKTAPPINLKLELEEKIQNLKQSLPPLADQFEQAIFDLIKFKGPISPANVAENFNAPVQQLQMAMFKLELKHYITKRNDGLLEVM